VAEHSVYAARHARGVGAGRAALGGLIREYERRGFWKLVSRSFPGNHASLVLHQRQGSVWWVSTGVTAGWRASGGTVSSWNGSWARPLATDDATGSPSVMLRGR